MAKYQIVENEGRYAIYNEDEAAFFSDFDFMGSAEWVKIPTEDCLMSKEDADEISRILEAADEPAEPEVNPADKQYLMKTSFNDEPFAKVMTGREIANFYEQDQLCGMYGDITVYDIEGEPKRISLLDLVEPILEQKRWMEQEYLDYCESERYGD